MSRLDRITRWVLEPAHTGRTLFLINGDDCVVGTNCSDDAICIVRRKSDWEVLAKVNGKHLVQISQVLENFNNLV